MRLDSTSLLVWYNKGYFYERQFELEKAVPWYQKCTASNTGNAVFNTAFLRLGDTYIQAEFYGRNGIKLFPVREDYWDLASIFSLVNKPADGIEDFEQYIKMGGTFEDFGIYPDLANLRAHPDWPVLVKKHFPDKVKH